MDQSNDTVIERVRVREVAGIFRARDARDALDATVDALLESGFDRADIGVSSRHAARQKLGIDIPPEEIPEVPVVPRRPFFGPADVTLVMGMGIGILIFAGAALGAFAVVVSGRSSAAAALAALVGGTIVGSVGAWIVRRLRREHLPEIDVPNMVGELVLFVRVRSSERETKAWEILASHGAEALRVQEIEIDKRLQDVPLSSLRVDPWLGEERLGHL
jgi:hypothetical protein